MKGKAAFTIGRYSPPHKGHINTFLWLLSKYQKLTIGIGSCYEVGTARHPLLAFFREKMIHRSLVNAGVDMTSVTFAHLQDFKTEDAYEGWNMWWRHVTSISGMKNVDALVTGNFEQIVGEIAKRKINLPFKLINPETEMPAKYEIPYHATDLRNAIRDNDYDLFQKIAASGTIELMGHIGGFSGIREALDNQGTNFIPGRQAVDLVVTCKGVDPNDGRLLLCGFRKKEKENFPGYLAIPGGAIKDYENPMDAAVREFKEETGLRIDIVNRYLEPAHVIVHGRQPIIGVMQFVRLFSTDDPKLGGNEGGSSQVFCIHLDCGQEHFASRILSRSDLESVAFRTLDYALNKGLAYQQSDMVRESFKFI